MEHPQDPQRGRARVLDAMHLVGRKVEAGTDPQRERPATDVSDSFSSNDVADLVIGVAVERRLARLDDSHELRHVEAAGVLVHEISIAPLARGFELGLVVVPYVIPLVVFVLLLMYGMKKSV